MSGLIVRMLAACAVVCSAAAGASGETSKHLQNNVVWETDYAATMATADRTASTMVIYFHEDDNPQCTRFDDQVEPSLAVQEALASCCCARLPLDAEILSGGKTVRLVEHPVFAGLKGGAGLVVLDFSSKIAAERGRVLKILPFAGNQPIEAEDLAFLAGPIQEANTIAWLTDYSKAVEEAQQQKRMLLIYFACPKGEAGCEGFESNTLTVPAIREELGSYVCLKLDRDAKVALDGQETVLLRHRSFSEMVGLPGIAIVDYSRAEAPYYGQVVSTFPFLRGKPYDARQMAVILNLPPGKLTQRTLIYAVRTHPDAPQSTSGELDEYLASEAESHSAYQARIRLQGHHAWESRFHRINARLPGGLLAKEVCAESWPGESLLEAAIDCVQCWRQSSGHWRAVRSAQPLFGYDMRRGSNGIWYATGIFGNRR